MPDTIKISELDEIFENKNINHVVINSLESINDVGITRKIQVCNFLTDNIVKRQNFDCETITGNKFECDSITNNKIQLNSISRDSIQDNSVDNRVINNTDNFTFNNINTNCTNVTNNACLSNDLFIQDGCTIDNRDISQDGTVLDELSSTIIPFLSGAIDDVKQSIKNGELTLSVAGIATGTTQTFSANQSNNTCFTITVPNTNLSVAGIGNNRCISSSTGSNALIPIVNTNMDGFMSCQDKCKLDIIESGAQVNIVCSVADRVGIINLSNEDVCLGNVTNHRQVFKAVGVLPVVGNIPTWSNNNGDQLDAGYGVETVTLEGLSTNLATSNTIKTYIDTNLESSDSQIMVSDVIELSGSITGATSNEPGLVRGVARFPSLIVYDFKPSFVIVYSIPQVDDNPSMFRRDLAARPIFIPWKPTDQTFSWFARYEVDGSYQLDIRAQVTSIITELTSSIELTPLFDVETIGSPATIRARVVAYK